MEYVHHGESGKTVTTRIKSSEIYTAEWKPWIEVTGFGDVLSELMDALIDFGVQPKQHNLTSEEKTALEKHLADMRKIVAKKIGVEL